MSWTMPMLTALVAAGLGTAALTWVWWAWWRPRAQWADVGVAMLTPGIRMEQRTTVHAHVGAGLIGVGVALLVNSVNSTPGAELADLLGVSALGMGVGVFVAIRRGRLGGDWLTATDAGLRLGWRTGSVQILWGEIGDVRVFTAFAQPAIGLTLVDRRSVVDRLPLGEWRHIVAARFDDGLALAGHEIVLFPEQFGIPAGWLARAVARYVREPAARGELGASASA